MPGLYKIGFTDRDVEARIAELSSATAVPTSFELIYSVLVSDTTKAEYLCHQALDKYRVNKSREFFKFESEDDINCMKNTLQSIVAGELLLINRDFFIGALRSILIKEPNIVTLIFSDILGIEFDKLGNELAKFPKEYALSILETLFRKRPDIWREFR